MLVYGVIAVAWVRAALQYRASFVALALGQVLASGSDFVAIVLMFTSIDMLAGFSLAEIALLYGLTGIGLGIADLLAGSTEQLGRRIRDGSLDIMLVRPVPTLVQVAADQFALRRLGRILQAGGVLVWALLTVDIDWNLARVVVILLTIASGAGVYLSIFVLGASYQFLAGDAAEVQNAFTYGGVTLTQYPLTVYPVEVVRAVTFLLPLAFVNWYPALFLLGRDDPFGLPGWVQLMSPVAAGLLALVAAAAWHSGVRHYRSTGS
jgi:ABC-2 type transport system permease protein